MFLLYFQVVGTYRCRYLADYRGRTVEDPADAKYFCLSAGETIEAKMDLICHNVTSTFEVFRQQKWLHGVTSPKQIALICQDLRPVKVKS